ncbi:MAG: hypothetical protein DCF20_12695 [Pseudanabaena sp.]|nr:MAG: hypothetical protein DCF20_12695 [Pseudanabaena sp.]
MKPLFNSLAGFALEVGDRLIINGEEIIFKGWVDQSQTAIEVNAIADAQSSVRKIRAKEIKSLSRSQDVVIESDASQDFDNKSRDVVADSPKSSPSESEDRIDPPQEDRQKSLDQDDHAETFSEPEEIIETPKEPEYNAWEVWTYLERQRLKTLKLINTFQAEWEANRFVREAERSAPANLRVHYEIRPVWLDEAEVMESYQNEQSSHKPKESQAKSEQEDYADAIDVEVITQVK